MMNESAVIVPEKVAPPKVEREYVPKKKAAEKLIHLEANAVDVSRKINAVSKLLSDLDSFVKSVRQPRKDVEQSVIFDWVISRRDLFAGITDQGVIVELAEKITALLTVRTVRGLKGEVITQGGYLEARDAMLMTDAASEYGIKILQTICSKNREELAFLGQLQLEQLSLQGVEYAVQAARTFQTAMLLDKDSDEDSLHSTFYFRGWAENARKIRRRGKKVYPTPEVNATRKSIAEIDKKVNGSGAVCIVGPAGTGKTENLVDYIETVLGRRARVISMHHWTTFSELLIQKDINGAGNPSLLMDQLEKQRDFTAQLSLEQFKSHVLKQAGNATDVETGIRDVIDLFCSTDAKRQLEQKNVTSWEDEEWRVLHESAQQYYDHMLGSVALFGKESEYAQEEQLILGELLLAIKRGEMPVLDEIDKVGQFAGGGLLRFLNLSPGKDHFQYGATSIKIPDWFRIYATSNETKIGGKDSFLADRFSFMYKDYPPSQDMTYIVMGWMANRDGNLGEIFAPFTHIDQQQMLVFLRVVLPKLQKAYREKQLEQPFSVRVVKEIVDLLIQGDLRTEVSIFEALSTVLLDRRVFSSDPNNTFVADTLNEHSHLFDQASAIVSMRQSNRPATNKDRVEAYLTQIKRNPFYQFLTTESMTIQARALTYGRPRLVPITSEQLSALNTSAQQLTEKKTEAPKASIADTVNTTGIHVTDAGMVLQMDGSELQLSWTQTDGDRSLLQGRAKIDGTVLAVAENCEVIAEVLSSKDLVVKNLLTGESARWVDHTGDSQGVYLSDSGNVVLRKTGSGWRISLPFETNTSDGLIKENVSEAKFSPSGRFVLVKSESQWSMYDVSALAKKTKQNIPLMPTKFDLGEEMWFLGNNNAECVGSNKRVLAITYV